MAIGPGSVAQSVGNPTPSLWTATDNDVIQVHNPLSEDFIGMVGQSKPVNVPFEVRKTVGAEAPTTDEASVQNAYGITLKNPDHFSAAQITTKVEIPTGATVSLLGGVAKVVVGQLVTEIMQREGNSLKMADPTARLEVEQRIIRGNRSVLDILPDIESRESQIQSAVDNLNQGGEHAESAFPTEASRPAEQGDSSTPVQTGATAKSSQRRPAKSR